MTDLENIKALFKKYSPEDIAKALFVLDMWLPNISSSLKISTLYGAFLSIKEENFGKENLILIYKDFSNFYDELLKVIPDFPFLEDFIPVPDRGEVKTTIDNKNYNILYGGGIDNIYDRVESFKIIFDGIDDERLEASPIEDLKNILEYQTYLVQNLPSLSPNLSEISPGYFEISSERFFNNCMLFLNKNFTGFFRKVYISELGGFNYDNTGKILDDIFGDKFLDKLFIDIGPKHIPIMPRRFLEVLIQYWGKIFKEKLKDQDFELTATRNVTINSFKFLKDRFFKNELIGINTCINKESGKFLGADFFGTMVSDKQTILFYNIPFSYFNDKAGTLKRQEKLIHNSLNHIQSGGAIYDNINGTGIQLDIKNKDEVVIIGIIPNFSLTFFSLNKPKKYPGYIWSLVDFVTIMDECDDINTIGEFLDWEKENKSGITSSIIDMFISFRNMNNVPIQGAIDPDMITFDHTIGNNHRYEKLSEFRSIFPNINPLLANPRSWKLENNHGTSVIISRIERMIFFGIVKIKDSNILIHSPFDRKNHPNEEQLKCYEIIMQCLSYYLQQYSEQLSKMSFFNRDTTLQISIFCKQYTNDKETYKHIHHLSSDSYGIDSGRLRYGYYGLRLCFDYQYCINQFSKDKNEGEIELFNKVLSGLQDLAGEAIPLELLEGIKNIVGQKPGFKISYTKQIPFAFPGYVNPRVPETKHYLKAKREISKLLLEKGVSPGIFMLEQGKAIIDSIKIYTINYINTTVSKFSFEKNIPFLITRFDSLLYKHWIDNQQFTSVNDRFINYDPVKVFSQEEKNFLDHIKNYRYCIEKFISLNSKEDQILNNDDFQLIIALIDWLIVFQSASDALYYGLFTSGITINDDFTFEITYSEDIEKLSREYTELESKIRLGQVGDNNLEIVFDDQIILNLFDKINQSFNLDLGFSFDNMMKILQILSLRGHFMGKKEYEEYNNISTEELFGEATKNESWIDRDKFNKIIDFLTIKSNEILTTYNIENGNIDTHTDIPIWEHTKRFSRYHLKPIININNTLFRGAINTKKTMDLWVRDIQDGRLPTYYKLQNTLKTIEKYKSFLDRSLEDYVYKKIKEKFPSTTEKNFEFLKRDPKSNPIHNDVGDYDIICYDENTNILWLFECKEILRPYSFKDSKRVRDDIFNKYVPKILKRENYMKKNINKLKDLTKRNIKDDAIIKPVYISSYNYWWTQYPTHKTNIEFITIKLLYDKLDGKI